MIGLACPTRIRCSRSWKVAVAALNHFLVHLSRQGLDAQAELSSDVGQLSVLREELRELLHLFCGQRLALLGGLREGLAMLRVGV